MIQMPRSIQTQIAAQLTNWKLLAAQTNVPAFKADYLGRYQGACDVLRLQGIRPCWNGTHVHLGRTEVYQTHQPRGAGAEYYSHTFSAYVGEHNVKDAVIVVFCQENGDGSVRAWLSRAWVWQTPPKADRYSKARDLAVSAVYAEMAPIIEEMIHTHGLRLDRGDQQWLQVIQGYEFKEEVA